MHKLKSDLRTPTPWEAQEFDPEEMCVPIIGLRLECPEGPTNGIVGCTTLFPTEMDAIDGIGPERAVANAAFIVKAVNSHDALVAAAQKVLDGLHHRMDHAASVKAPIPVFDGVAELHCALASIKEPA